jgi:glucose-6-phosphate-specific signal transduction histidine kinase
VTSSENQSTVTVTNQCAPASTSAVRGHAGRGLTGLRELTRLLGGSLDARDAGGRFEITAVLPHRNEMGNDPA